MIPDPRAGVREFLADPDETGGATAGLSRAVLTDDQRHIGVPMLLRAPGSRPEAEPADRFSTASYLQQAALGRSLLETGTGSPTSAGVLSLNFHAVPTEHRRTAEDRIRRLLDLGDPYHPGSVTQGPLVMVAVFDGDQATGRWAADFCARLGVRAYFFPLRQTLLEDGPRLDDDDLAAIAVDHELCFHSSTHRAAAEIDEQNLDAEVLSPLARLTQASGRVPRIAAWRGGGRFDPTTLGDRTLRASGVTHLVSNWSIETIATVPPPSRSSRSPD